MIKNCFELYLWILIFYFRLFFCLSFSLFVYLFHYYVFAFVYNLRWNVRNENQNGIWTKNKIKMIILKIRKKMLWSVMRYDWRKKKMEKNQRFFGEAQFSREKKYKIYISINFNYLCTWEIRSDCEWKFELKKSLRLSNAIDVDTVNIINGLFSTPHTISTRNICQTTISIFYFILSLFIFSKNKKCKTSSSTFVYFCLSLNIII